MVRVRSRWSNFTINKEKTLFPAPGQTFRSITASGESLFRKCPTIYDCPVQARAHSTGQEMDTGGTVCCTTVVVHTDIPTKVPTYLGTMAGAW